MRFLGILLLFCSSCFAQFNFTDQAFLNGGLPDNILFKSGSVGGADTICYFLALQNSNAASWFIPTASGTAVSADLSLSNGGTSPSMNMAVQVWTYDSGLDTPGTPIGTQSDWVSATNLTSSFEMVRFTGMSCAVTSGTDYCLVLYCDAEDFINNVCWDTGLLGSPPAHSTIWAYNQQFAFWGEISTDKQHIFIVYK